MIDIYLHTFISLEGNNYIHRVASHSTHIGLNISKINRDGPIKNVKKCEYEFFY